MALEDLTGVNTYISALNPSWPIDDDFLDEGDNHIRGIKNVLKNTFPNLAAAVTLTAAQLNAVAQAAASNRVINGRFNVDQRQVGAAVTLAASGYSVDRWRTGLAAPAQLTVQREAIPALPSQWRLRCQCAVVDAGPSAVTIEQFLEGTQIADLNLGTASAQPFTVAFEAEASIAGTFALAIRNGAANRSYVLALPMPVGGTLYPFSFTVPGDTTGVWPNDGTLGMRVSIVFGNTPVALQAAAGAWAAGNFIAPAGGTNLMATAGNAIRLRNVRLYKGSTDFGVDQRSFAEELRLCQRYFEKTFRDSVLPGGGSGTADALFGGGISAGAYEPVANWIFCAEKRAAPTMTLYNVHAGGAAGQWTNHGLNTDGANARALGPSTRRATIDNGGTTLAAGNQWYIAATADADL